MDEENKIPKREEIVGDNSFYSLIGQIISTEKNKERIRKNILSIEKENSFSPYITQFIESLNENKSKETILDLLVDDKFHEQVAGIIPGINPALYEELTGKIGFAKPNLFTPNTTVTKPFNAYTLVTEHTCLKSTLTQTEYIELSREFAARIAEMDKDITSQQMASIMYKSRTAPLIGCLIALGRTLEDKAVRPNKTLREAVELTIQKYETMFSGSMDTGWILNCSIPEHAHVKIFDPTSQNGLTLDRMLQEADACTNSSYSHFNGYSENSHAHRFSEDSKKGGSVHFTYKRGKKVAYGRIYIAIDKDEKPIAFFDCIEAQDLSRTYAKSYVNNKEEDMLAGAFAAGIEIARRLGLDRIAFGEYETTELARDLSYPEKRIFEHDADNRFKKLGYIGGITFNDGPAMWKMQHGKSFRVADIGLYADGTFDHVVEQTERVMERINSNRKSLKPLKKDYESYLGIVLEIANQVDDPRAAEFIANINAFCEKYMITPRQIQTANFSELQHPGRHTETSNVFYLNNKIGDHELNTGKYVMPMANSSSSQ